MQKWRLSFYHFSTNWVVVSEPEGLSSAIIGLTRHSEGHSLVKEFKSPMRLYGSNGTQDGWRDGFKEIERLYGPDETILEKLEFSEDGFTFRIVYTGEIGIQTIVEDLAFDHGLEFTGVQDGYWRKAMARWDVPVNIQSPINLDGEAVTVYTPENLILPTQIMQKTSIFEGLAGLTGSDAGTDNYLIEMQVGMPVTRDEISETFNILFDETTDFTNVIELGEAGDIAVSAAGDMIIQVTSDQIIDTVNFILRVRRNDGTEENIGSNSDSPGATSVDITLPFSGSQSYPGNAVGDLFYLYIEFGITLAASGSIAWSISLDGGITFVQQSIFPETNNEAVLIHDLIASVLDRITDSDKFYSELLGSPDTRARVYAEAGCYWNNVAMKGLLLRGYTLSEKQFAISMKEIWEGLNPHLNLYLGYEKIAGVDRIRLEEKSYGYDPTMSVLLSGVQKIKRKYSDKYFNSVQTGSTKGAIEDISGIDDPQKETRASIFKNIGRKLDILSTWITQSLTFEWTRRSRKEKSADNKFDNDTFMIEVTKVGSDYTPRLDEDYDSVTNLQNEATRINKRWTPARMFLRWSNWIFMGCQNYIGTVYRFVSGEGNYDMTSERKPDDCSDNYDGNVLAENADITVTSGYLYIPVEFEIEHYMSQEDFDTIDANKTKAIGISQGLEADGGHAVFFITDLQREISSSQIKLTGYFKNYFNIETVPPGGQIFQNGKIFEDRKSVV